MVTYSESQTSDAGRTGALRVWKMPKNQTNRGIVLNKAAAAIMVFLGAVLGNVRAQAPTLPTLPQKTVTLTLPIQGSSSCPSLTTGSNCIRNVQAGDSANFQKAINAATCGDTIVLASGSTYSGNFTIPATSCSGWILVVSSALANLPAPGNRIGPSNEPSLATVMTSAGGTPAIRISDKAHNWRFIGLEISAAGGSTQNALFDAGSATTVTANIPTQIIVDRCYIHGATKTSIRRGIALNVAYGAVVDSYISDIFSPGYDSQAILVWNGPGPLLYQNNFLSAASENTLFGGADPLISGLVPGDITIVGNWYWKDYANWNGAGYNVKNCMEFKSAQRVFVDGNVVEYSWADGQTGNLVSIKSVNQTGTCPWCGTADVTFTHNIVRHGSIGVMIGNNDGTGAQPVNRVLIQNNVLTDISSTYAGGGNGWAFYTGSVTNDSLNASSKNETIDHNSAFADVNFLVLGDTGTIPGYQLTNNIAAYGTYGIKGGGQASGTASLNTFVPGAVYSANVLLTANGTLPAAYPKGTFSNTISGAGFTNYGGANYQLTSNSPYHVAATDGKNIGVWDWTCLNNDTAAALAGDFVPSQGCSLKTGVTSPLLSPPSDLNAVVQ